VKRSTNKYFTILCALLLLTAGVLLSSFSTQPDDYHNLLRKWPAAMVKMSWEKSNVPYLKTEEKNTLFYINLARINPRLFFDTFVNAYRDTMIVKNKSYIESLKTDMYKTMPMPPLEADITLFEVAKNHAIQMGQTGKVGHSSIYGDPYQTRMDALTLKHKKLLEACQYGYSRGLLVVLDLLIDDGVSNLGHRKALLNELAVYAGISMQNHRKYNTNTVIELAYEKR
jgi:hypothetical protein